MTYVSLKTFGREIGLSAAFCQWRAPSHCRLLGQDVAPSTSLPTSTSY